MEETWRREETAAARWRVDGVKLSKLTEEDDIEAFLTVFERVMAARGVPEEQWPLMLAPQLTGKAQQAYAAVNTTTAANYQELKGAILL